MRVIPSIAGPYPGWVSGRVPTLRPGGCLVTLATPWTLAAVATLWSLAAPIPIQAQQEVQVALDREGRVEVVDLRLAGRLGVFVDRFPGFQEARLWIQLPDSTYILEITGVREGRRVRERSPLGAAEVEALRADISGRIDARAPAMALEREGRPRLLGGTALLGLGFYGWAVPVMFDVDEATTAVGLYMLTAGSAFFGPWAATRHRSVSPGTADLALYGGSRGIVHGLLAHRLITGGDEDDVPANEDIRGEVAMAMAFSLAEGIGGYAWATDRGLDMGTTRTIGMAGDFGMLQGLGLAVLTDLEDGAGAAMTLAGAAGGLALGPPLARRGAYSVGDVTALSTAGYLGGYAGVSLVDMFQSDSDQWYAAGAMAGNAAGLFVGDRLARRTEFTPGQGWLVALGTVAGGAVGLGGAYLLVGNDDDHEDPSRVYFAASTLGAAAGYGVTFRSLAPDAARFPQGSRSGAGGLALQLHAAGVALAASGAGGVRPSRRGIPLVTGSYRF